MNSEIFPEGSAGVFSPLMMTIDQVFYGGSEGGRGLLLLCFRGRLLPGKSDLEQGGSQRAWFY